MSAQQSIWHRLAGAALLLLLAVAGPASAEHLVQKPNGDLVESAEDIRVKVRGGHLVVTRTWTTADVTSGDYRWHINPLWADLEFSYDPLDGSVSQVVRAGSTFERTGDGVFVFDEQYFIRREEGGWRWHDRSGEWIRYDEQGGIRNYGNPSLTIATFDRDADGLIHQVRDAHGQPALTFQYQGGRIASITDAAGRNVQYGWTGDQLRTVRDVRGETWTYAYSGNLLQRVTDPRGYWRQFDYSRNRVVRVLDEAGHSWIYEYEFSRQSRTHTVVERSPEGVVVDSRFNHAGQLTHRRVGVREVRRVLRDGKHVVIEQDARGLRVRTEFDAHRNPVLVRFPDGSEIVSRYDAQHNRLVERTDQAGVRTTFQRNDRGLVTEMVEAVGTPVQRRTTFTYTAYGEMKTRTVHGETAASDATTTWTYDAAGNIATVTDPEQFVTRIERHHPTGQPERLVNAEGEVTEFEYDPAGLVQWVRNAEDELSSFGYDEAGNLTSIVDPELIETTLTYAPTGQPTSVDRGGEWSTHFFFDKDRRPVRQEDGEGIQTQMRYDTEGRLAQLIGADGEILRFRYGEVGSGFDGLLVAIEHPGFREEFGYDQQNRRVRTTRVVPATPEQGEQRHSVLVGYDARGLRISETLPGTDAHPDGRALRFEHDALGRLTTVSDPMQGVMRLDYDVLDNVVELVNQAGQAHRFEYDLAGRHRFTVRPLGQPTEFRYDGVGRLVERIAADGRRRVFEHDGVGRVRTERYYASGQADPDEVVTYAYDNAGRLTGYVQTGTTHSQATYTLNALGQRLSEDVTYGQGPGSVSFSIAATYAGNGAKLSQTFPGGTTTGFEYHAGTGRQLTHDLPGGGALRFEDYVGATATRVIGPGFERTIELDAFRRPVGIRVDAVAGVVMDYGYTFQADGTISRRDTEDGAFEYEHDLLGRLTRVEPPPGLARGVGNPGGLPVEEYAYDAIDNRIASAHQPGSWNYDGNGRLRAWGSESVRRELDYSDAGEQVRVQRAAAVREFDFSASERLSVVRDGALVIARYGYDPFGRRISKEVAGQGITWFAYAEEGLIAELGANGQPTRLYGWEPDSMWGMRPVFQAERLGTGWESHVLHTDLLGAPQRATNPEGETSWMAYSEAFGLAYLAPDRTIDVQLRLPGQYFDAETGLHYNFFRTYDPATGRYLREDPLGLEAGVNPYGYAFASPLVFMDATGELAFLATGVAGGLIGGITGALTAWARGESVARGALRGAANGALMGMGGGAVAFLTRRVASEGLKIGAQIGFGGIGNGSLDLGWQLYDNARGCHPMSDINWSSVRVAAVGGALGATIAPGTYSPWTNKQISTVGEAFREVGTEVVMNVPSAKVGVTSDIVGNEIFPGQRAPRDGSRCEPPEPRNDQVPWWCRFVGL